MFDVAEMIPTELLTIVRESMKAPPYSTVLNYNSILFIFVAINIIIYTMSMSPAIEAIVLSRM